VYDDHLTLTQQKARNERFANRPAKKQGSDKSSLKVKESGEREGKKSLALFSADPHAFMARLLQYCECPQYLRRHFFPMHPDLQFAGLLPPMDAPHHVRADDRVPFREGVVLDTIGPNGNSLVNCGIRNRSVE
jgi:predicted SPOUT superfamily RNA methylase MTH1